MERANDDDDCVMLSECVVPLPLPSTTDGLVKYENDLVSMNKAFITTVHIFIAIFSSVYTQTQFQNLILHLILFLLEKWSRV